MGTTMTVAYVGDDELVFAHVGDSRAYLMRDSELERLTHDHSLVDEMLRRGKITEEEAAEHPQRSVITRALGPEASASVSRSAGNCSRFTATRSGRARRFARPRPRTSSRSAKRSATSSRSNERCRN